MKSLLKHYQDLYAKYGTSPEAVQYTDIVTHNKRFEILYEIAPEIQSITDFGCGLAALYKYLKNDRDYKGEYLGLDFVPEFIEENKKVFSDDKQTDFLLFDIYTDKLETKNDYVFLNGVFNNKTEDNEAFMYDTIKKMMDCANKGVAFNAMSTYVDYMDEHLFYVDPMEVFAFCKKEITSKVALRHDYQVKPGVIPFEFTVYLYK